jgi:hypothetical protein
MNIPETLKMPSLSGSGKRPKSILKNQRTRFFYSFESSFGLFLAHLVCLKSVK